MSKQYASRNPEGLGNYYFRHLDAMTTERLHLKCEIAAELAWRDREIDRLKAAIPKTADGVLILPGTKVYSKPWDLDVPGIVLDDGGEFATVYCKGTDFCRVHMGGSVFV
jgi:hypothetical protein